MASLTLTLADERDPNDDDDHDVGHLHAAPEDCFPCRPTRRAIFTQLDVQRLVGKHRR